jgi:hypothetical protein
MFFGAAHDYLEGTLQDIQDNVVQWSPRPGPASILGQYAHIVASEDWLVNVKARGGAALMATIYAGRTGFQTPPPVVGWDKWAHSASIDFAALRDYAQAVYRATDEFLGATTDDFLRRPIDLSEVGMGEVTASHALVLAAANVSIHTGEISALKGLCGLTGYPALQGKVQQE